jgi:hypothetical protein
VNTRAFGACQNEPSANRTHSNETRSSNGEPVTDIASAFTTLGGEDTVLVSSVFFWLTPILVSLKPVTCFSRACVIGSLKL